MGTVHQIRRSMPNRRFLLGSQAILSNGDCQDGTLDIELTHAEMLSLLEQYRSVASVLAIPQREVMVLEWGTVLAQWHPWPFPPDREWIEVDGGEPSMGLNPPPMLMWDLLLETGGVCFLTENPGDGMIIRSNPLPIERV